MKNQYWNILEEIALYNVEIYKVLNMGKKENWELDRVLFEAVKILDRVNLELKLNFIEK